MTVLRALVACLVVVVVGATQALPTDAAIRKLALGISIIDDQNVSKLDAEIEQNGRKPAIWSVWSDWGGSDKEFPAAFTGILKERGIIPMVFWQPTDPQNVGDCTRWSNQNVLDGDHDDYIRRWAQDAKAHGGRILLRLAHEMNGYWFVWGYSRCTNTPQKFKAMWQHVWQIFHEVGASNVKFLWSPFGAKYAGMHYPGDAYVDYMGATAFNWGPPRRKWRSLVTIMKPTICAYINIANKPIIIAELGAAYLPNCGVCNKTAWLKNGFPAVHQKWPRVKALIYFDIDMRFNNQPDWRLNQPPSVLQAYRTIAADSRFQGQLP